MRKSRSSLLVLFATLMATCLSAQDTKYPPQGEQIPGPANPTATSDHCCATEGETPISESSRKAWLEDVLHWRRERLIRIGYSGSLYDRPELQWTQRAFIQPQMMAHDRYFYDPESGTYTVDRYLADLDRRYGGIDAVLIWPTPKEHQPSSAGTIRNPRCAACLRSLISARRNASSSHL